MDTGIPHFKLNDILTGKNQNQSNVLIIAPRGTGKSFLIKAIMYEFYKKNANRCTIWSPGSKSNNEYTNITSKDNIYYEENEKISDVLCDALEDPHLLIIDDCVYSPDQPLIKELGNIGNPQLSIIMSIHYPIKQLIQDEFIFEYVFIGNDVCHSNKQIIWRKYFPHSTFEVFNEVFEECTENYSFMVVKHYVAYGHQYTRIYKCKPTVIPEFTIDA